MRVFADIKFLDRGAQIPLQPVSCGMVAEDGREMYVINQECVTNVIRNPWASMNLQPSLPIHVDIDGPNSIHEWNQKHPDYPFVVVLDTFAQQIQDFLAKTPDSQVWMHYGAHSYVVLCQLFGSAFERPPGVPPYYHELQQEIERRSQVALPPMPNPDIVHHAMWDARWVEDVYYTLYPSSVPVKIIPADDIEPIVLGVAQDDVVADYLRKLQTP